MDTQSNVPQLAARAQFKGSEAKPRTRHQRITRRRGKASDYQCCSCPAPGRDWAQVHTEDGEDPWADYVPLCRRCHRRYDQIGPRQSAAKKLLAATLPRDSLGRFAKGLTLVVATLIMSATVLLTIAPTASAAVTSRRYQALEHAEDKAGEGCWYNYGHTGPCSQGYDCSGLVYAMYHAMGFSIPRTTYDMLAWSGAKPTSDPDGGDLVFYGSGHVELYQGRHTTVGALEPGTRVGYHRWYSGSSWRPTEYLHVIDSG